MSQTYAPSALPAARDGEVGAAGRLAYPLLGLLITSVVPAVFWTALIGLAASGLGMPIATEMLAFIAISIMAFLGLIWAAIARRSAGSTAAD